MMFVRTLTSSLLGVLALSIASCNNSQQRTKESTSDTTATAPANTTATTAPASNIVTTPQNMLVVMQKVASYSKWKPVYDGHDTARVAAGLHSYVIGRGVQ